MNTNLFLAGLGAGMMEAIFAVTPSETIKLVLFIINPVHHLPQTGQNSSMTRRAQTPNIVVSYTVRRRLSKRRVYGVYTVDFSQLYVPFKTKFTQTRS